MRYLKLLPVVALAIASAPACDDEDPFEPTVENVAGTYVATRLNVTENGFTFDALQLGVEVLLTLEADGTTSGRLFAPGGDEDGSDLDADLTGTWQLAGNRVTLEQSADTFLRDITMTAERGRLVTNQVVSDTRFDVVLTKQ